MSPDDERHGTYAGYNKHRRDRETLCGPCREAARVYQKAFRSNAGNRRRLNESLKASSRALWRLVDLHRTEYEAIRAEELGLIRQNQRVAS